MKSKTEFGLLFCVLLMGTLFVSSADALPLSGALSGWEPATAYFDYTYDGRTLTGQVDYAVYDSFDGNPLSGGSYVYAYQIFNSIDSDVSIDSFSIAILDEAVVTDIGWVTADGGGEVEPSFAYFSPDEQSPQSAIYLFMPQLAGVVGAGQNSTILLFSSDSLPQPGFGIVEGGSIGESVQGLPTPVPEPTTIFLIGAAAALMALTRKRPLE